MASAACRRLPFWNRRGWRTWSRWREALMPGRAWSGGGGRGIEAPPNPTYPGLADSAGALWKRPPGLASRSPRGDWNKAPAESARPGFGAGGPEAEPGSYAATRTFDRKYS